MSESNPLNSAHAPKPSWDDVQAVLPQQAQCISSLQTALSSMLREWQIAADEENAQTQEAITKLQEADFGPAPRSNEWADESGNSATSVAMAYLNQQVFGYSAEQAERSKALRQAVEKRLAVFANQATAYVHQQHEVLQAALAAEVTTVTTGISQTLYEKAASQIRTYLVDLTSSMQKENTAIPWQTALLLKLAEASWLTAVQAAIDAFATEARAEARSQLRQANVRLRAIYAQAITESKPKLDGFREEADLVVARLNLCLRKGQRPEAALNEEGDEPDEERDE